MSEKIGKPSGHFSQATMFEAKGRLVFISGMLAKRADGSIAGVGDMQVQATQVCENLKAAVEEAGAPEALPHEYTPASFRDDNAHIAGRAAATQKTR